MALRPELRRQDRDIKPGRLADPPPDPQVLARAAAAATYKGSGKHKNYPSPNGEWQPVHRGDTERCSSYRDETWQQFAALLRDAIRAGIVSDEFEGGFPKRVWAWLDGVLHEARLTNSGHGEYHAFPLSRPALYPTDQRACLPNAPRWPR